MTKRGEGIRPPQAERRIQDEADERGRRQAGVDERHATFVDEHGIRERPTGSVLAECER
jgi:hypothetical protein